MDKKIQKRVVAKLEKQQHIIVRRGQQIGGVGVRVLAEDGNVQFFAYMAKDKDDLEKYFKMSIPYSEYLNMSDKNFMVFIHLMFRSVIMADSCCLSHEKALSLVTEFSLDIMTANGVDETTVRGFSKYI